MEKLTGNVKLISNRISVLRGGWIYRDNFKNMSKKKFKTEFNTEILHDSLFLMFRQIQTQGPYTTR